MLSELSSLYTPAHAALALRPGVLAAVWALAFIASAAGYLARSGVLYWLFYVSKADAWRARKIQPAPPSRAQIEAEIRWSLRSCGVYSLMTVLLFAAALKGWTRFYLDVSERGWGYFALSFVLMLVLHDAYFYASHRLSHKVRWVFRHLHRIHHMSGNPTPFADIMFHPVDAVIHAGFVPLFLFALPLHPLAFVLFMGLVQAVNAIGHIGFEFFPLWLTRTPLLNLISRPTAHNVHHSHVHCNYGLYFAFWDRLLGTEKVLPRAAGKDEELPRSA